MTAELHFLENSLIDFLISEQSEKNSPNSFNAHKYTNLKIYIDLKKSKVPHFIIRLGISESIYSLVSGDRISGSLGSDERYVRKWLEKDFVQSALEESWEVAKTVQSAQIKNNVK